MRVPEDYAGRRVRCKKCGAVSAVPKVPSVPVASLGSVSAILDVTPEPAPEPAPGRRIELVPDDRIDALVAEGASVAILAELGRTGPVAWPDLIRLAREATEAGISLTVSPKS